MAGLRDAFRGQLSDEILTLLEQLLTVNEESATLQTLTTDGAVSLDAGVVLLNVDGTDNYTLADGTYVGQKKDFICIAAANVPAGILTPDNFADGTTATFDAVGESLTLVWDGTNWRATSVVGTTIA